MTTFAAQLQDETFLWVSLVSIIGLMVGSFLNVVIYRLPEMTKRSWLQQCAELRGETAPVFAKFNLMIPRSACMQKTYFVTLSFC